MKTYKICFDPHSVQIFGRKVEPVGYYFFEDKICSFPWDDGTFEFVTFSEWKEEISVTLNVTIDWDNAVSGDTLTIKSVSN